MVYRSSRITIYRRFLVRDQTTDTLGGYIGKIHLAELITVLTKFKQNIQGDSGGICTTLGNDSMSDSKQKSSYEHGSDFERLRSYDRLKLGI